VSHYFVCLFISPGFWFYLHIYAKTQNFRVKKGLKNNLKPFIKSKELTLEYLFVLFFNTVFTFLNRTAALSTCTIISLFKVIQIIMKNKK